MILSENTKELVNGPDIVRDILVSILKLEDPIDQDKEHFWVIGLNTQNQIQYIDLTSLGILDASIVHPREVFRLAIMKGINSIIIAHNHPSGNLSFSENDLKITDKLIESGEILGIKVLDHVLVTMDGFHSFKQSR